MPQLREAATPSLCKVFGLHGVWQAGGREALRAAEGHGQTAADDGAETAGLGALTAESGAARASLAGGAWAGVAIYSPAGARQFRVRDGLGEMKAAKQGQLDLPMVTARAATIHQADHVPYWIVLDYQDGLELLKGTVPDTVRSQIVGALQQAPAESQAEYLARVEEGATA